MPFGEVDYSGLNQLRSQLQARAGTYARIRQGMYDIKKAEADKATIAQAMSMRSSMLTPHTTMEPDDTGGANDFTGGLIGAPGASAPTGTPSAPAPAPDDSKLPIPTRLNNPLSMKHSPLTTSMGGVDSGTVAQDGGTFAKFETPDAGFTAATAQLQKPLYQGLTTDEALKKWSNNGYGDEILPSEIQGKKMSDLTDEQLDTVVNSMAKREGYVPRAAAPAPAGTATVSVGGGPTRMVQVQHPTLAERRAADDAAVAKLIGAGPVGMEAAKTLISLGSEQSRGAITPADLAQLQLGYARLGAETAHNKATLDSENAYRNQTNQYRQASLESLDRHRKAMEALRGEMGDIFDVDESTGNLKVKEGASMSAIMRARVNVNNNLMQARKMYSEAQKQALFGLGDADETAELGKNVQALQNMFDALNPQSKKPIGGGKADDKGTGEKIRVRLKVDATAGGQLHPAGTVGTVDSSEFDPKTMDKLESQ